MSSTEKNNTNVPVIPTPYINLQSDFGFKRMFGTPKYRKALIQFLNAILGDEIKVTDVKYHDKEVLPATEKGKRIVYDVYCTMNVPPEASLLKPHHLLKEDRGKEITHHFILEMQNIYEPPFEDRMLYYATKAIAGQGYAGWNYDLDPVISVAITDFDFSFLSPQLKQDFRLMETTTGRILTNKFRMLFYSLKQVPGEWRECKTEIERLLYLIKNMEKLDKNSIPYKEGGYEAIFDAAESQYIVAEDAVLYSQSLERLRSYQAGVDYAAEQSYEKGMEKGMEKGIEKGMEKGRHLERINTARILIELNLDDEFIKLKTGLPIEQIRALRSQK